MAIRYQKRSRPRAFAWSSPSILRVIGIVSTESFRRDVRFCCDTHYTYFTPSSSSFSSSSYFVNRFCHKKAKQQPFLNQYTWIKATLHYWYCPGQYFLLARFQLSFDVFSYSCNALGDTGPGQKCCSCPIHYVSMRDTDFFPEWNWDLMLYFLFCFWNRTRAKGITNPNSCYLVLLPEWLL